jgi:hypothetical protein
MRKYAIISLILLSGIISILFYSVFKEPNSSSLSSDVDDIMISNKEDLFDEHENIESNKLLVSDSKRKDQVNLLKDENTRFDLVNSVNSASSFCYYLRMEKGVFYNEMELGTPPQTIRATYDSSTKVIILNE